MNRPEPQKTGSDDRRRRLITLLATAEATEGEAGASASDRDRARLDCLCLVSVSEAHVSGAGVTVMAGVQAGLAGARDQVSAIGARTRPLEDLQLTTGEGPCLDAYGSGMPVLVGELAGETARWPGYGPEALRGGTCAVFSLPLQVGAVSLGTLDLNRETVGPLSATEFADVLLLAGLATETLLELADTPDGSAARDDAGPPADDSGWLPGVHAEVHQASGMVSVRAGIGVGDALLRLRAHAFSTGVSITEVARRVVARELVLDADDP